MKTKTCPIGHKFITSSKDGDCPECNIVSHLKKEVEELDRKINEDEKAIEESKEVIYDIIGFKPRRKVIREQYYTEDDFKKKQGIFKAKQFKQWVYYKKCSKCGKPYYRDYDSDCGKH